MKSTRLRLGKAWKEMLDKGIKFHSGITLDHPYIKEYLNSIVEEPKPKEKKGKKVK